MSVAGTLLDGDSNAQILPGQLATASLGLGGANVSFDPTTFQWSASGYKFYTFVVGSGDNTGTVNKLSTGDWKVASPSWRWVGSASATVTGAANVIYSPPGYPSVMVGTASDTKAVEVVAPNYEVRVLAARDGYFQGDILFSNPVGLHAVDFMYDATTPADFIATQGAGKCQFTQFLMNTNYYVNGVVGMTSASTTTPVEPDCLDGSYIYQFSSGRIDADGSYGYANDSPYWGAAIDLPGFLSFSTSFTANSYCMYGAPGNSNDVPLGYQAWTWNAAMSRVSGGSWNMTGNHSAASGAQTDVTAHKEWKHKNLRTVQ